MRMVLSPWSRVGVAVAVVLERLLVLVELPAVQLDDQVMVGEDGIDLSAVTADIYLRDGEVVFVNEGEELVLE